MSWDGKMTDAANEIGKGANFRASKGDERRGYGAARGAKKSAPKGKSPDVEFNDKFVFIDAGGGDGHDTP